MKFYSHIGEKGGKKELKHHLKGVGEESRHIICELPIKDKCFFSDISYLIGISHDFGKYTSFFQEYLINQKENKLSQHSFISAIFTAWQIQEYLDVNNNFKSYSYIPLIGYFIVLHHHGDLRSIGEDIPSYKDFKNPPCFSYAEPRTREKLQMTYKQIEDFKRPNRISIIENEYKEMVGASDIKDFLNTWLSILKKLNELRQNYENEGDGIKIALFLFTLLLYSILIDSDKRDAGNVSIIKRKKLMPDLVDRYREKQFNLCSRKTMDIIRNQIYKESILKIEEVSLENHLYTLTAPTGSGKTLTSFSVALNLRTRIEKEKGYMPRIIYSLPFITIIEQNYEVIRNVLCSEIEDFKENETAYILKHHYLSDLEYKEGDELKPLDESLLLIESWNSEVVITTFIQLLHTIIGFKNSFLKKYHNIAGSIILLDEVQNIPIEYWDLVEKVIKIVAEYFGCYFILLTATKPLILKEEYATEIVKNPKTYFEKLNRVLIKADLEKKNIDDFIKWFIENYNQENSYLIVANTIKSSKEIYEKIKTYKLKNPLFYLSTSIIPKHRAERIKKIKSLLDKNNIPILVSTQVVEAGVDIDFDVVIRDIGPLDSIIQVAGRCNREYTKDKKELYVFSLGQFASYVYGKIHPEISRELLNAKEIPESNFYDLINNYFEKVKFKINDDVSRYIWESMLELRFYEKNPPVRNGFEKMVSAFQLIKEKGEYIDIFVEIDEDAKNIWERYCKKIYEERDFLIRRNNYLKIRKEFRSYIISIRNYKDIFLPSEVCGMRYIPKNEIKNFYSPETGFCSEIDTLIF
ncbi:MAG TPA: CRISPR-associated helicase Cas3' [bacterium]|nr:CRISPR-associated helicase Cas3' [bacterium]